jgi:hypothetical protein
MTPTTTATAERRRSPRRQPAQGTVCKLTSSAGDAIGLGLVWNISQTGVSMLIGAVLQPGAQLKGELIAADGHTTLGLGLKVAHLSRLATGDYFLGTQFERSLSTEELQPFVGDV